MDSEGKQHGLSNTQWLLKLVFLVDVTEKMTNLNASLQAGLWTRCHKESGFLGGVGFSTTLEVGFFIRPLKSNWIIHYIALPIQESYLVLLEMVELLKLLMKPRIRAVHHDFYWLVFATKMLGWPNLIHVILKSRCREILEARSRRRTFYLRLRNQRGGQPKNFGEPKWLILGE